MALLRCDCWLSLFALLLVRVVHCVPLEKFYPYGVAEGDTELLSSIASSPESLGTRLLSSTAQQVTLRVPVSLHGHRTDVVFIDSQGVVAFNGSLDHVEPLAFPQQLPLLAPYWTRGRVDLARGGHVFYRTSNQTELLEQVWKDVELFSDVNGVFHPTTVLVITWLEVLEIHGGEETNTFQCVVVTDGEYSFALFLYLDQGIQWGEGAQMGISSPLLMDDATPANWSFSLPGALTKQSVDIESTTNTGTAGKWAFRIDTDTILQPHVTEPSYVGVIVGGTVTGILTLLATLLVFTLAVRRLVKNVVTTRLEFQRTTHCQDEDGPDDLGQKLVGL